MSFDNHVRCLTERAIVRALIRECRVNGFVPHQVDDGEELVPVGTEDEAIDAVFAVDESRIRFRAIDDTGPKPKLHNVLLIGGNGTDIISDWHCGNASFNAAVDRVAMNVEDLVQVSLALFIACGVKGPNGEACRRPHGHAYSARERDHENHESGAPDYKRW